MAVAHPGVLALSAAPLPIEGQHRVRAKFIPSCSLDSASSTSVSTSGEKSEESNPKTFNYSRASPSVRWPNLKLTELYQSTQTHLTLTPSLADEADASLNAGKIGVKDGIEDNVGGEGLGSDDEDSRVFHRPSRNRAKKMNKLALKRAKDWKKRVQVLTDKILGLSPDEYVADVLDRQFVQMTPTDYCFLVKWLGKFSWQRALEVYEWLNLKNWYSPNARMLATILAVLGKASQEALAVEIFTRVEPSVGNTVQVYNAMMGVYARNGRFTKVQELLDLMRQRGCEPDLVSFNTLINARLRSGPLESNLSTQLLDEVRRSGIRPDIITYNTLISACSRDSNLQEAIKVYSDMETHNCQPDLWTYNAMISVFARCGLANKGERLLRELESKGFIPDSVTYNSLLYAFSREGNVEKVGHVCQEMAKRGLGRDEMTYNTIINMYGKLGQCDTALQLYRDMKSSGQIPDAVTYTVLIDSLGKASKMSEAEDVMSEMVNSGVKPTLRTFSALIHGYGKAGNQIKAEETFSCMLKSGIRPDRLAYFVMMDIRLKFSETRKAMSLYKEMVGDGVLPDQSLYRSLVQAMHKDNDEKDLQRLISDMEKLGGMNPLQISSILVKGECYDAADNTVRSAVTRGYDLDPDDIFPILSSYCSSGRHTKAQVFLNYLEEHATVPCPFVEEGKIVVLCQANQPDEALKEYARIWRFGLYTGSCVMYEALIKCCEESELFANASQIFSDMRFCGVEPSQEVYHKMVSVCCKMSFPETAWELLNQAEGKGVMLSDVGIYVSLIEAYGKVKKLQDAESLVAKLRQRSKVLDRKVWNVLMQAYAASGFYEKARAAFNTMMKDGPSPTVETMNFLMQALIVDGRLNELYVVVQELQDMGFKISKSTVLLMLEAFARASNLFEVKKIYNGMKASGYLPTMHLYKVIIGLFSRAKKVRDVEGMFLEMEEAGFKPDIVIWNSLLKMYTDIEDYLKTADVYKKMRGAGIEPDESTYNTLILMYCRDRRPEEGLFLMHEMRKAGLDPKLDTYKSLIAACAKRQLVNLAEELFEDLQSKGYKLDRSFHHIMMKMYRDSGDHSKAEAQLVLMKEAGVEPTIATMHLLMLSCGSSGQPEEAEKILDSLKLSGADVSGTLPYSSVIDAYLKNGDYNSGIQKLEEMKKEGIETDHRIWTCFIRAASLCQSSSDALLLLESLRDSGFDLALRLLMESSESLVAEVDRWMEKLEPVADNAALNFVNALEDLLWAFELRATASWVFQLAVKRRIYQHNVFRVAERDWGADVRKLSAGAALVAVTLWLDLMQDASLEGSPESPKSVVLITGASEYNMVSLSTTVKAFLWEMGSPFLPCPTRTGILVAKAHSLRMWLKDSPFCFDLELKNTTPLPESNSMHLIEGCFIRAGLVPAFKDIKARLGDVWPKKFARLALLSDDRREKAIQADIEGRKEKLEKMKRLGALQDKMLRKRKLRFKRRPFVSHSQGGKLENLR